MTPARRLVGAVLLAAAAVPALQGAPRPDPGVPVAATVDIKVAVASEPGCGPFADTLPALVSVTDLSPGAASPATVVCLRNQGGAKGTATLSIVEVAGREDACSAGEAAVDSSCGAGLAGELQDLLIQEFALLERCSDPSQSMNSVQFGELAHRPLGIGPIGRNATRCVALRLRYPAGSSAVADTDSVSWRYAFQLTA